MTAAELYAAAPFGSLVHYSDGTPRPPERFTKKVKEWKKNNGSGVFVRTDSPGYGIPAGFGLVTCSNGYMTLVISFRVTSTKSFTVDEAAPVRSDLVAELAL